MKIKAMTIGVVVGALVMSTSAMSEVSSQPAKLDTDAITSTITASTQGVAKLTSQLLSENPEHLEQVLTLLLQLKPESAQQILAQAMSDYEDLAEEFAALAKQLGIANEVITIAAIEAGVDPTQLAEYSAAGESVKPAPSAPSSKHSVSQS